MARMRLAERCRGQEHFLAIVVHSRASKAQTRLCRMCSTHISFRRLISRFPETGGLKAWNGGMVHQRSSKARYGSTQHERLQNAMTCEVLGGRRRKARHSKRLLPKTFLQPHLTTNFQFLSTFTTSGLEQA